jgi:uncharacterized protein
VRKGYKLTQSAVRFLLYRGMQQFFQNGGGVCWIVSAGQYGDGKDAAKLKQTIDRSKLEAGIQALELEQEPTMLVAPDAVLLPDEASCILAQQAMLQHCGLKMKNRFAILDVYDGHKSLQDRPVVNFRDHLGAGALNFAAAYYPFLHTSIVHDRDLSYENVSPCAELFELLQEYLGLKEDPGAGRPKERTLWDKISEVRRSAEAWRQAYEDSTSPATPATQAAGAAPDDPDAAAWIAASKKLLNSELVAISPGFKSLLEEVKRQLNLMPPSPAMAGIYCMVDNTRGVWKAPANVSINGAISPSVNLSNADQEDLNVTTQGKSINAIRAFIGEGVLVWGARTLDGNSLDWRYINVRRTMIMLEESCRLAAKAMVFEPNVANTWVTIKSMISNLLTGIWKRGGLTGAVPDDAFSVHVGLGETMTPEDILEGILRVTVLVAISRPAEFIEITFQQKMQES